MISERQVSSSGRTSGISPPHGWCTAAVFHALQPGHAAAAQDVHQHRLNLVIGGMRHQHRPAVIFFRQGKEESIAAAAGGLFDRQVMFPGEIPSHPVIQPRSKVLYWLRRMKPAQPPAWMTASAYDPGARPAGGNPNPAAPPAG